MNDPLQDFGHAESEYLRPDINWRCSRANSCLVGPSKDGHCSSEDQPCQPYLSARARKRRVTFWIFAFSVACVTLLLSASSVLTLLSPGPLSINHAEVASCADCHSAASEPMSNWLHKAMILTSGNDDQKCLACHELGETAFLPHSTHSRNFSSTSIDSLNTFNEAGDIKQSTSLKLQYASFLRESNQSEEVSCSVCHREHQGKFAPIDAFDAQQCHTCHQVKFSEIDIGHPQYSDFPHTSPTQIHFDHTSHLQDYFYQDDYFEIAPEGCKSCHETDQSGEWMLSGTFETSCSSCHLQEILGENRATAKGVVVFSIPELDTQTLREAGLNIGEWPDWADGELVPFMRVLLPGAVQNSEIVQNTSLRLYDLSTASQSELQAAALLAWEIKQLFYDVQMGGTQMLNERLQSAFQEDLDQSTLNRLIASLPKDTLVNNQREWFPSLMQEVATYRRGDIEIGEANVRRLEQDATEESTASNVEIDQSEIVLTEDDTLIDDILDDDLFAGDDILLSDDLILDDDLLADDIIDIDLSDDELTNLNDDIETVLTEVEEISDNEEWAITGGWYRDGSNILYRPNDHADLFFKTWLDVSSLGTSETNKALFNFLNTADSVGKCVECHSVRDVSDVNAVYAVNWYSFKPRDVSVDFNRFSHVAHFSLMNDDGCSSCHLLNSSSNETVIGENLPFTSSFLNMDRETCTQCHQQGRAPDNCLTCHNYHAERQTDSIEQISDRFSINGANDD